MFLSGNTKIDFLTYSIANCGQGDDRVMETVLFGVAGKLTNELCNLLNVLSSFLLHPHVF